MSALYAPPAASFGYGERFAGLWCSCVTPVTSAALGQLLFSTLPDDVRRAAPCGRHGGSSSGSGFRGSVRGSESTQRDTSEGPPMSGGEHGRPTGDASFDGETGRWPRAATLGTTKRRKRRW